MKEQARTRRAICVYSGLSGFAAGGVQESGRIGWHAIVDHVRSLGGTASIIVYGEADNDDLCMAESGAVASRNRWGMLRKVALRRWDTPLICFWHLDLLRLLPFMRLGRAKKVVFLHGVEAWRPQSRLTRHLLGQMDLFLINTRYTWERFLSFQPQLAHKPHQIVPLGIGSVWKGESPAPDKDAAVLMLGRLDRGEDYKGHRQIIAAWPRILKQVPGARLWIAGDGNLRPDLERQAQNTGAGSAIRFWGRVTEEKKLELLQKCRCLAMPSRGEGFGLVYLEGMRLGRPCLISPHDAAGEVVDPPTAGLSVDPDLADHLVEALLRLMTDGPEWQRFSRDARLRYESEFTAEKFQSRLVQALFEAGSREESPSVAVPVQARI